MKSPEILFIYPKPSQGYGPDSFVTYFGTTYLEAFLKQKGIATQQFIQDDYFTMSKLIEKICNTNAKIIGFTCYDTNYYYVRLLAEAIKKVDPQKKIIVGGPTATFSDKLIMEECPGIDTCFQGESEFSLYEIIYKSFENPDEIEGITYRQDTVIKRNKNRPLIFAGPGGEELNILPSPYLSGIIDETWKGNLAIQSVRGCRFDCTYCNFPGISGHRLRYFSIERVLGELEIIGYLNRKLKKNVIFVFDDNFGGNKERAKLLCRAMLDANIKLPLRVDIHVESLDRELIRMMSELGFFSVNIGLESANPKVLRNINKVLTINSTDNDYKIEKNFLKKVSRVVKWAQEENLAISVSIIQGLPGEGIHEAKETLEFVEKLGVEYYYHNQLKIFPGTKLFNHHKRFGINIVKSATTLPYNTIPAYDLRKVPPRKNSDVYGLNKSIAYDLISHYWGTWNFDSFWSRNRYILLDDVEKINSEFLEWLKHFIFLFDNIAIRSSSAMDKKATEEIHAKILNVHIPSNRIYFIIPANGAVPGENFFANEWNLVYSSLYKPIDRIYPLIKRVSPGFVENPGVGSHIPYQVIIMSFLVEKEKSHRFINHMLENGANDIAKNMIKKGAVIEDGCRWASALCPGVDFRRVIIDKCGKIRPCFSSPASKDSWCDLEILRNCWKQFMQQEESRRKCHRCPVNGTCSKCIYTDPFTAEEFCTLKRNMISEQLIKSVQINYYEWIKS